MKITIECKSKELFKLGKSVLLELRRQHEEDTRHGQTAELTNGMVRLLWQLRNEEDATQDE